VYVEKIEGLFNMVTIENHLKWRVESIAHPYVDYVFSWAENHSIPVHGHCLFCPSYKHCPDWLRGLPPDEVYRSVISHIENYTREYRKVELHTGM